MITMIKAIWTGKYPNLCSGTWKLYRNDEDISNMIPEELRHGHMNTFNEYSKWHFNSHWSEEWDTYTDGLDVEEWIQKNDYWLNNITNDYETKVDIYFTFQASDWRYGECGGCI